MPARRHRCCLDRTSLVLPFEMHRALPNLRLQSGRLARSERWIGAVCPERSVSCRPKLRDGGSARCKSDHLFSVFLEEVIRTYGTLVVKNGWQENLADSIRVRLGSDRAGHLIALGFPLGSRVCRAVVDAPLRSRTPICSPIRSGRVRCRRDEAPNSIGEAHHRRLVNEQRCVEKLGLLSRQAIGTSRTP